MFDSDSQAFVDMHRTAVGDNGITPIRNTPFETYRFLSTLHWRRISQKNENGRTFDTRYTQRYCYHRNQRTIHMRIKRISNACFNRDVFQYEINFDKS